MTKSQTRQVKLLEMLQLNKRLDVKTVADSLSISEATVRRLFSTLEKDGKVLRIHGGVQIAPEMGYDYSYRVSALHRSKEKSAIGNYAARIVSNNDRIFLDSGTTVLKLAEALSMRIQTGKLKNLVVLTNSLTHIETIARWCKVILIGGEIRVERRDVCGSIAEKVLAMFHVKKAFFGADAISARGGFMTTDERTSQMNEIVIDHADESYVLADSEKFNKSSFITYANFDEISRLYTDRGLSKSVVEEYKKAGAEIEFVH
jgi:DeoR family transcriptional regulator, fructose operon transcriptional repressor